MSAIRWHNRLAAWLHDVIAYRLADIAMPVWQEKAEQDAQEQREAERRAAAYGTPREQETDVQRSGGGA